MGRKCVGWRLSSSRSFFYATCVNSTILSPERASFAMCVRAFFFPCLCYDRAVLSGYVTYFEFCISSIFSCICWRNKEWKKKLCCCVLKCHSGNNVPTHRLFIVQCFWEVGFSSALLVCLHWIFGLYAIWCVCGASFWQTCTCAFWLGDAWRNC